MDENPIQYDAENYAPKRERQGSGGIVGLIMKTGLVKDAKQANSAMITILAICFVVGVGVWFVL